MKKAFTYIQTLTVISLFLILFALFSPPFFKMIRNISQKTSQINRCRQLNRALDIMQQDILFAEKVTLQNNEIYYFAKNINYSYLVHNNRLARKKSSYLYLTPKEINVTALTCQAVTKNFFVIELTVDKKTYRRNLTCLN